MGAILMAESDPDHAFKVQAHIISRDPVMPVHDMCTLKQGKFEQWNSCSDRPGANSMSYIHMDMGI